MTKKSNMEGKLSATDVLPTLRKTAFCATRIPGRMMRRKIRLELRMACVGRCEPFLYVSDSKGLMSKCKNKRIF